MGGRTWKMDRRAWKTKGQEEAERVMDDRIKAIRDREQERQLLLIKKERKP